jgi:putative PIN family toxin of toxin-antitoxin system
MRIVIDTNILVSAAIADGNPEKVILFVAENNDFQWIVSDYILSEYKKVLNRKKLKLSEEQKHKWFNILDNLTVLIEVDLNIDFPRDRKDAPFVACAIIASADYLITGDQDFSDAQKLIETKITSVADFLKQMNIN